MGGAALPRPVRDRRVRRDDDRGAREQRARVHPRGAPGRRARGRGGDRDRDAGAADARPLPRGRDPGVRGGRPRVVVDPPDLHRRRERRLHAPGGHRADLAGVAGHVLRGLSRGPRRGRRRNRARAAEWDRSILHRGSRQRTECGRARALAGPGQAHCVRYCRCARGAGRRTPRRPAGAVRARPVLRQRVARGGVDRGDRRSGVDPGRDPRRAVGRRAPGAVRRQRRGRAPHERRRPPRAAALLPGRPDPGLLLHPRRCSSTSSPADCRRHRMLHRPQRSPRRSGSRRGPRRFPPVPEPWWSTV